MTSTPRRLLDLFCGRWGWSRAFAARGWECVGVDLVRPLGVPDLCTFLPGNIQDIASDDRGFYLANADGDPRHRFFGHFDFVCASSPCEQFSVHGMKHFHPNPPYPELGIKLFEHTRNICEVSGVPYVMENVRAAQQFVGDAANHCGPFYLWGTGVPPMMPQGISKGMNLGSTTILMSMTIEERRARRKQFPMLSSSSGSKLRQSQTASMATIPPELSACVADYAERICVAAANQ